MEFSHAQNVTVSSGQFNEVHGDQHIYQTAEHLENTLETLRLASVMDARHNYRNHRPPCDPGTRFVIIGNILEWIGQPGQPSICWLYGKAGSGKSAIAQSVSEECFATRKLVGASFFFNRQEQKRCGTDYFAATVAYQLAISNPILMEYICNTLREDKAVIDADLHHQIQKLILEPLQSLQEFDSSLVLVIDALDECDDHEQMAKVLTGLVDAAVNLRFPLRIFITSRQEPIIPGRTLDSSSSILRFNLQEFAADADIRSFLQSRLQEIRQARNYVMHDMLMSWPSREELDGLVKKSSGLFVYASTVAKFIGDKHAVPQKQLKAVLEARDVFGSWGHTELDGLYTQVASASPNIDEFKLVIGAIILVQTPLSPRELGYLLGVDAHHLLLVLERCHPILSVPDNPDTGPVTPLHLSLRDFLTSKERAGRFYIDPSSKHTELAKCCLNRIKTLPNSALSHLFNPTSCWDALTESLRQLDVPQRVSTRYACRYWSFHGSESLCTKDLMADVKQFCWHSALSWRIFMEMDALQNTQDVPVQTPETQQAQEQDLEKEFALAKVREQTRRRRKWISIFLMVLGSGAAMKSWMEVLPQLSSISTAKVTIWRWLSSWDEIQPGSTWYSLLVESLLLGMVLMASNLEFELALAVALGVWLLSLLGLWVTPLRKVLTPVAWVVSVAAGWGIAFLKDSDEPSYMEAFLPLKRRMLLVQETLKIAQRVDEVYVKQQELKRCVIRANDLMTTMPFPWRFMFYGTLTPSVTQMVEELVPRRPPARLKQE